MAPIALYMKTFMLM